jgi:sortase (surface protein transpeptidase)
VPVPDSPARPRGGRLLTGAAAALIAAGSAVLGFDACQSSGPPQPAPSAARPRAATKQSGLVLKESVPVRVDIPRIGVHSRLLSLGLEHDGTLEVPSLKQAQLAGWYDKGPTPGERGPAVIVGHVDTKKGPAVFYGLGRLRPGDAVNVTRKDGKVAAFTVDSVEHVSKKNFPTSRVYGEVPFAGLRLITCGGDFNGHNYTGNIIVYGHLATQRPVEHTGP